MPPPTGEGCVEWKWSIVRHPTERFFVTVTSLTPNVANGSEDVDSTGRIMVLESLLYHLVHFDKAIEGEITLRFDTPGVEIYSFTFGGELSRAGRGK